MEEKTPLMATLLVVARAIQNVATQYPREAAPYFMAAYNAVLDVTPAAAVWMWQIVKMEERIDQHRLDCVACKSALDCPGATKLKFKLEVYRARLVESETWTKKAGSVTPRQP